MRKVSYAKLLWILICMLGMVPVLGLLARARPAYPPAVLAGCPPVQNTPRFTIVYGQVNVDGIPAEVGRVVEARSPRGDTVGCFVVETAGHYGAMYVYGEDTSADPPIPGMRSGETVTFHIDGVEMSASPELVWQDDKEPHEVTLSADIVGEASIPVGVTVILQQGLDGYTGCEDTHIYQDAPDDNYCSHASLRVGQEQQYAALVRFDLSSIPADATVSQATLQLYATGWDNSGVTIKAEGMEAYRVLRDWDDCQATWNVARSGDPWGQPGCNDTVTDRGATPDSSVSTIGINQFDLTQLVQQWVRDSLTNRGVLLRGASSQSKNVFYFASAENGTINRRPKLVITYVAPLGAGPTLQGKAMGRCRHLFEPADADVAPSIWCLPP